MKDKYATQTVIATNWFMELEKYQNSPLENLYFNALFSEHEI